MGGTYILLSQLGLISNLLIISYYIIISVNSRYPALPIIHRSIIGPKSYLLLEYKGIITNTTYYTFIFYYNYNIQRTLQLIFPIYDNKINCIPNKLY